MLNLDGFAIKKYSPALVSIEIHSEKCPPTNNKIYKFFILMVINYHQYMDGHTFL